MHPNATLDGLEHRLCLSPACVFTAKRIFVNVTKVGQVQQVIVNKLVVGAIVKFAGLHCIIWILGPESTRDQCRSARAASPIHTQIQRSCSTKGNERTATPFGIRSLLGISTHSPEAANLRP